jgi:dynein heavy chain
VPKEVTNFHEIFVPTSDSLRHHYVLATLVANDIAALLVGRTGTGKTVITKRFLLNDLDASTYRTTFTAFSANTTAG